MALQKVTASFVGTEHKPDWIEVSSLFPSRPFIGDDARRGGDGGGECASLALSREYTRDCNFSNLACTIVTYRKIYNNDNFLITHAFLSL